MWTHPGKKLLFMGSEFGQWNEWNYDTSLQWDLLQWESHQGLQRLVARLESSAIAASRPCTRSISNTPASSGSIATITTRACWATSAAAKEPSDFLVIGCNFTPAPRLEHRLGVPELCWYEEIFNSDSTYYGGSNLGNGPGIMAEDKPSHGRPHSLQIVLPPLAVTVLKPRR